MPHALATDLWLSKRSLSPILLSVRKNQQMMGRFQFIREVDHMTERHSPDRSEATVREVGQGSPPSDDPDTARTKDKSAVKSGDEKASVPKSRGLAAWLESITKISTVVLAMLYVFGLLTVNGYLYGVGLSDFGLFRPRYVFAGFLFVLSLIVPVGAIFYIRAALPTRATRLWEEFVDSWKATKRKRPLLLPATAFLHLFAVIAGLGGLLFWFVAPFVFYRWLLMENGDYFGGDATKGAAYLIFSALGVASIPFRFLSPEDEPLPRREIIPVSTRHHVAATAYSYLTFFFMALGVHVLTFAQILYPVIPEQFGGGRPRDARLYLDSDSAAWTTSAGFATVPGSLNAIDVQIIWEDGQTYSVRPMHRRSGPITQIAKVNVQVVISNMSQVELPVVLASPLATPAVTSPTVATPTAASPTAVP